MVLEKTLESPLDCKEIQPVHPKGNQSWIITGKTDAEAETPILWPPDVKNWLTGKYPDAEKDWRQEEKGMTEDEMVGWHHWLNGHEFEQVPGVGDGQGSLLCCSPWGRTTEQLKWTDWAITGYWANLIYMVNRLLYKWSTDYHRTQASTGRRLRTLHHYQKITVISRKEMGAEPWWEHNRWWEVVKSFFPSFKHS